MERKMKLQRDKEMAKRQDMYKMEQEQHVDHEKPEHEPEYECESADEDSECSTSSAADGIHIWYIVV